MIKFKDELGNSTLYEIYSKYETVINIILVILIVLFLLPVNLHLLTTILLCFIVGLLLKIINMIKNIILY